MNFNRKSILKAIESFFVVLISLTLIPAASTTCAPIPGNQTTCDQNNCSSECEQANDVTKVQENYI